MAYYGSSSRAHGAVAEVGPEQNDGRTNRRPRDMVEKEKAARKKKIGYDSA
jgi:hypothetical protein